ncbi:MAG: putative manganese transporter [Flavobacteriales bacterium]
MDHFGLQEGLDILFFSLRDGFVQVSAFVAITVLLFSYLQYRTGGRAVDHLRNNKKMQPIFGALLGLMPGCGGAIIVMPLYVRGTVSFGTVVAALAATAGDSAFVILALAPQAALYAYGMAFIASVLFGYAIDSWGLGVSRVDRAVSAMGVKGRTGNGFPEGGDKISAYALDEAEKSHWPDPGEPRRVGPMTRISHAVHLLWWALAITGLIAGVLYLVKGAPEVAMSFDLSFFGLFTISGLSGTLASFYLHFVGRRYLGKDEDPGQDNGFSSVYDTFRHSAMETSMVTVWVIVAYLLYEYSVALFQLDIGEMAAAAGVMAPIAGTLLGWVPGCAPQIVLAQVYAEGGIPFSTLTANAISQDGDALFPLMAIDGKAAIVATIYTSFPAFFVGILLHYFWPLAEFGFGVLV